MISKIGEFFNTEIQPTIGGQLLWLVATVLVTLIVTLFFSQTGKIIKKVFIFIKKKILEVYNSPSNQNRRLYKKIKKSLKKPIESKPIPFPNGVPLKLQREFLKAKAEGRKLSYEPLHDIIVKYELEYPQRLEEYYVLHPEEKKKDEEVQKNMQETLNKASEQLRELSNFILPRK